MSLNMDDPFLAHAVFALRFVCDRCGGELSCSCQHEFASDAYYSALAVEARRQEWFCAPRDLGGKMHVMFCLCPGCGCFKEQELKKTKWQRL